MSIFYKKILKAHLAFELRLSLRFESTILNYASLHKEELTMLLHPIADKAQRVIAFNEQFLPGLFRENPGDEDIEQKLSLEGYHYTEFIRSKLYSMSRINQEVHRVLTKN